jgi:hypothetical protein
MPARNTRVKVLSQARQGDDTSNDAQIEYPTKFCAKDVSHYSSPKAKCCCLCLGLFLDTHILAITVHAYLSSCIDMHILVITVHAYLSSFIDVHILAITVHAYLSSCIEKKYSTVCSTVVLSYCTL